ncbi:MAG: VCBS repeat-containing protein [Polyangiales bacterium]
MSCGRPAWLFALLAAGCDPALDGAPTDAGAGAPRLLAPLSTSVVRSARPTLRWAVPHLGRSWQVTLCEDPACAHVIETVPSTGTSARPEAPLRPGPVFWKVSAVRLDPSPDGAMESETWEFFVPAGTGAGGTARCCVPDINFDGVPDPAIYEELDGAIDPGGDFATVTLGVWPSTPEGYRAQPEALSLRYGLRRPSCSYQDRGTLVRDLQYLGDVDGDGWGDLSLLIDHNAFCGIGMGAQSETYFHPVLRTVAGFALASWARFTTRSFGGYTSELLGSAGDIDGDGRVDFAIETMNERVGGMRTVGVSTRAGWVPVIERTSPPSLSGSVERALFAADVDGDGFADVVLLEYHHEVLTVTTMTLSGRRSFEIPRTAGFDSPTTTTQIGVPFVGDLDGDGIDDVAFNWYDGQLSRSWNAALRGGPGAFTRDDLFTPSPRSSGVSLYAPDPLVDVNGDGRPDSPVGDATAIAAVDLTGGADGVVPRVNFPHCPAHAVIPSAANCAPYRYSLPGDFNRDGYTDLYEHNTETGALAIYAGSPTGLLARPIYTTTLAHTRGAR